MNCDYRQCTRPVVIGSGQRLVREGSETRGLRLLDRQACVRDVIVVSYASAGDDEADSPLFDAWNPQPSHAITKLAMAMLGVSPEQDQ